MGDIDFIAEQNPAIEPLLDHWVASFGEPPEVFRGVWEGFDCGRRWHFCAKVNKELAASIMVYLIDVADSAGGRLKLAGVANVSTLPKFRCQGLSSQVLLKVKEALPSLGADFSLLYTGIPQQYAKAGYSPFTEKIWQVKCEKGELAEPESSPEIDAIKAIYQAHQASMPFTMSRPEAWWSKVWAPRLADRHVWQSDDAYLVADLSGVTLTVIEAAGELASLTQLIQGASAWSLRHGCMNLVSRAALPADLRGALHEELSGPMFLPGRMTAAECLGFINSPQSAFLLLDHF